MQHVHAFEDRYLCTVRGCHMAERAPCVFMHAAFSYCVLIDLGLNTLRGMVSPQWQDKAAWASSRLIRGAAEAAKAAVLSAANAHDRFLAARDPVLTLRIAAAFSALSVLSSIFRSVLLCRTQRTFQVQ